MSESMRTNEFLRLFAKDGRWIFSYILMFMPHKADAEEVFQETSIILWKKFDEYVSGSSFLAWATQVAHYQVLHHYRTKKQICLLLLDEAVLEAVHHTAVTLNDRVDDLHQALEKCRSKLSDERSGTTRPPLRVGRHRAEHRCVARALPRALFTGRWNRIHQALYECIHRRNVGGRPVMSIPEARPRRNPPPALGRARRRLEARRCGKVASHAR